VNIPRKELSTGRVGSSRPAWKANPRPPLSQGGILARRGLRASAQWPLLGLKFALPLVQLVRENALAHDPEPFDLIERVKR
jgi:hypothetical protein